MSELHKEDIISSDPKTLLQELKEILKDPALRLLHAAKPKPAGYSKRSNTPYYKPRYGLEVKAIYDKLMETGENHLIPYSDHPGIAKTTIYARLNQGRAYLLDHLDTEGKYKVFDSYVDIGRPRGKGVQFTIILEGSKQLIARRVEDPSNYSAWKHELEEFIENAPEGESWRKEGLCLGEDERELLEGILAPLVNISYNITVTTITLRKIPVDLTGEDE